MTEGVNYVGGEELNRAGMPPARFAYEKLMSGAVMSFEVMLQKVQRVDTRAAALADTGSLLGLSHRHLFEHR